MAGPFKGTMFFSCVTGQGWSESWYETSSGTVQGSFDQLTVLAAARGNCCGAGSALIGWRSTDLSNPRLTVATDFSTPPQSAQKGISDNPVNSILCRAQCGPNRGSRSVWLRGCPDIWTELDNTTGKYEFAPSLGTALKKFGDQLIASHWCLRTVAPAKGSPNISIISGVAPSVVTGAAVLTLNALGTFVPGVNAIVSGFRYPLEHLNGTYPFPGAYSAAGLVITLTHKIVGLVQTLGYNQTGQIRAQTFTYQPVLFLKPIRPGDRKVGKVLGLPRGRRSAK